MLAQTRTALKEANAQKKCGAEWYEGVRDFYRGVRTEEPSADAVECVSAAIADLTPPKARQAKRK